MTPRDRGVVPPPLPHDDEPAELEDEPEALEVTAVLPPLRFEEHEVTVIEPPASHVEPNAPQFLSVLRVLDVPEALGLLAPRRLTLQSAPAGLADRVAAVYATAGASARLERTTGRP